MKFKTQQEDLLKALNSMVKLTAKLPKESILNNIQISKLNDDYIRLIASDGFTSIRYDILANDIEGESVLYNVSYLTSIVSRLVGVIEFDDKTIKNKISKFKVSYNVGEYPQFVFDSEENGIKVNYQEFKNVLAKTSYAVAKDGNGLLTGTYINGSDVVATDGYRLVLNKWSDSELEFLLPKQLSEQVLNLFIDDEIIIKFNDKKIIISDSKITLTGGSLIGKYPQYKQLLPKEYNVKLELQKKDLVNAINTITPVLNKNNMIADFTLIDNTCTIRSAYADSEGMTEFDIDKDGDNFSMTLNTQFVLDFCKYADETITIEYLRPLSPIVFKSENMYSLIMTVERKN